jgi:hypothetical protein
VTRARERDDEILLRAMAILSYGEGETAKEGDGERERGREN